MEKRMSNVSRNRKQNRRKRRIRIVKVICHTWIILLTAAVCMIGYRLIRRYEEYHTQTKMAQMSTKTYNKEYERIEEDKAKNEQDKIRVREIYANNRELLVLVNKSVELPEHLAEHYREKLQPICRGRLKASKDMYEDFSAMLNAAYDEGYQYWINCAYRDRDLQQKLVDEDVANFINQGMSRDEALQETLRETMPPGYSEHETGLAVDIVTANNGEVNGSQANEPGNQWLQQHCVEYGFILRYPEDKEDITQINYEPWHFRYVGKEAAEFISSHHLCLEEFVEMGQSS